MISPVAFQKTETFVEAGTALLVDAVSLADRTSESFIPERVGEVFSELAPHAKQSRIMLVIRDTDGMELERDTHPWYWARGAREAYVGLRHWKTVNSSALISAISACLYTVVREEYLFPVRAGERIVGAGAASYFAAEISKWQAPWLHTTFDEATRADVFKKWSQETQLPYAGISEAEVEEFEAGFGAELVRQHFGDTFDIEESLTTPVDSFRKYVLG